MHDAPPWHGLKGRKHGHDAATVPTSAHAPRGGGYLSSLPPCHPSPHIHMHTCTHAHVSHTHTRATSHSSAATPLALATFPAAARAVPPAQATAAAKEAAATPAEGGATKEAGATDADDFGGLEDVCDMAHLVQDQGGKVVALMLMPRALELACGTCGREGA